ncbi:copper chaperone PCu(A)C [Albidovulum sp.]
MFDTVIRGAALAAALITLPALAARAADGITIEDAYARIMPGSQAGAAFMRIRNDGGTDDRLIGASAEIARRAELHTHRTGANGEMQMLHVPEGFAIPAGGSHDLARGGDHVMLMGLTRRPAEGESFALVLTFEKAGEITIEVPVDNRR